MLMNGEVTTLRAGVQLSPPLSENLMLRLLAAQPPNDTLTYIIINLPSVS